MGLELGMIRAERDLSIPIGFMSKLISKWQKPVKID